MKIVMGLTEIAGYYSNLKKGFRRIAVDCAFFDIEKEHPFEYHGDDSLLLTKWLARVRERLDRTHRDHRIRRRFWKRLRGMIRILLFFRLCLEYDVFIFCYLSTYCRYKELRILKALGKKIIYVFHGSDVRPPYINGALFATRSVGDMNDCVKLTRARKRIIKTIETYADVIVSSPTTGHLQERPFVNWFCIGIPYDHEAVGPEIRTARPGAGVRILHAPSLPEAKGTGIIREAVEAVKSKGHSIEYIEVVGKTNAEVLDELSRCDFVVDQLYSDTPMAGFATEAAFFGKPAVVGSYYIEEIHRDIPGEMIAPSLFCHPDRIEEAVEKMVVDEVYRVDLGNRAKEFVQKHWAAERVAERYMKLIQNDIPQEWFCEPKKIRYLNGVGFPENRVKELIGSIVDAHGKEALQVADKPDLESALLDFACSR